MCKYGFYRKNEEPYSRYEPVCCSLFAEKFINFRNRLMTMGNLSCILQAILSLTDLFFICLNHTKSRIVLPEISDLVYPSGFNLLVTEVNEHCTLNLTVCSVLSRRCSS